MTEKPTYDDLLEKLRTLGNEVETLRREKDRLTRLASRHREVEKMAVIGHWELDLVKDRLFWSDEIFRIFDLDPRSFGATYEAFLEVIHPDDREYVNNAYRGALAEKTGYDIVHRLLLRDGTLKYVNEKCVTHYDEDGTPLRSLGTVQDVTYKFLEQSTFCGIVGRHPAMLAIYETIEELAEVDIPVIVQGESGTGKELVANAVHQKSVRASKPFVPVNCGALPEALLESELFGHVKGAFTGAIRNKKGRFELADGGTLFLDEIADLSKPVQVKLLRVLQEGCFEPVGGEKTISVNVRIISAVNRDLRTEVARGHFREDLYYRIKVVPIDLPPLRDRRSDIPLLLDYFIQRAVREGYRFSGIQDEAMAHLMDYSWPGNVRELQSAVHYALIKSRGEMVSTRHLPLEVNSAAPPLLPSDNFPAKYESKSAPPEQTLPPVTKGKVRAPKLTVAQVIAALDQARGNKVRAAKILGVGRATLYRFLRDNVI